MTRSVWGLLITAVLLQTTSAHFQLVQDYSGLDFVNNFDFYTGPDPTNGHVQFKGAATANATGLTGFLVGANGTNVNNAALPPPVYLGVDYTNVYPNDTGRPSVRVSSVQSFNQSLIIADIEHMPSSTCGLWPAFWLLGTSSSWPNAGEIDILENVNDNDFNVMTLHTAPGLTVSNDTTSSFDGTLTTSNCDVNAPNQPKNSGCSIQDKAGSNSYGTNFNKNNGGVFAVLYTSEKIAIWFFSRGTVPPDVASNGKTIDPSSLSAWGKPRALFRPVGGNGGDCNSTTTNMSMSTSPSSAGNSIIPISPSPSSSSSLASFQNTTTTLSKHFSSLQIIFDTTFCGDWAGAVWNSSATCSKLAPTCEEYVSSNPQAFKDAYWAIQSVRVFQDDD